MHKQKKTADDRFPLPYWDGQENESFKTCFARDTSDMLDKAVGIVKDKIGEGPFLPDVHVIVKNIPMANLVRERLSAEGISGGVEVETFPRLVHSEWDVHSPAADIGKRVSSGFEHSVTCRLAWDKVGREPGLEHPPASNWAAQLVESFTSKFGDYAEAGRIMGEVRGRLDAEAAENGPEGVPAFPDRTARSVERYFELLEEQYGDSSGLVSLQGAAMRVAEEHERAGSYDKVIVALDPPGKDKVQYDFLFRMSRCPGCSVHVVICDAEKDADGHPFEDGAFGGITRAGEGDAGDVSEKFVKAVGFRAFPYAVAMEAESMSETGEPFAIALPSLSVDDGFESMLDLLEKHGVPYSVKYSMPVDRTPLGKLLVLLLPDGAKAREDYYCERHAGWGPVSWGLSMWARSCFSLFDGAVGRERFSREITRYHSKYDWLGEGEAPEGTYVDAVRDSYSKALGGGDDAGYVSELLDDWAAGARQKDFRKRIYWVIADYVRDFLDADAGDADGTAPVSAVEPEKGGGSLEVVRIERVVAMFRMLDAISRMSDSSWEQGHVEDLLGAMKVLAGDGLTVQDEAALSAMKLTAERCASSAVAGTEIKSYLLSSECSVWRGFDGNGEGAEPDIVRGGKAEIVGYGDLPFADVKHAVVAGLDINSYPGYEQPNAFSRLERIMGENEEPVADEGKFPRYVWRGAASSPWEKRRHDIVTMRDVLNKMLGGDDGSGGLRLAYIYCDTDDKDRAQQPGELWDMLLSRHNVDGEPIGDFEKRVIAGKCPTAAGCVYDEIGFMSDERSIDKEYLEPAVYEHDAIGESFSEFYGKFFAASEPAEPAIPIKAVTAFCECPYLCFRRWGELQEFDKDPDNGMMLTGNKKRYADEVLANWEDASLVRGASTDPEKYNQADFDFLGKEWDRLREGLANSQGIDSLVLDDGQQDWKRSNNIRWIMEYVKAEHWRRLSDAGDHVEISLDKEHYTALSIDWSKARKHVDLGTVRARVDFRDGDGAGAVLSYDPEGDGPVDVKLVVYKRRGEWTNGMIENRARILARWFQDNEQFIGIRSGRLARGVKLAEVVYVADERLVEEHVSVGGDSVDYAKAIEDKIKRPQDELLTKLASAREENPDAETLEVFNGPFLAYLADEHKKNKVKLGHGREFIKCDKCPVFDCPAKKRKNGGSND